MSSPDMSCSPLNDVQENVRRFNEDEAVWRCFARNASGENGCSGFSDCLTRSLRSPKSSSMISTGLQPSAKPDPSGRSGSGSPHEVRASVRHSPFVIGSAPDALQETDAPGGSDRRHDPGDSRTAGDASIAISARVYGVPTFRFNEAIKRNKNRFPPDFMFQLDEAEFEALQASLRSQFAILKTGRGRHRKYCLSLSRNMAHSWRQTFSSPRAVQMSVFVVRAFLKMRALLGDKRELAKKLAALERELTQRLDVHEAAIVHVLQRVMDLIDPPALPPPPQKPRIGFTP